jgi:site-specific DNA-adenine methylase
MFSYYGRKSKIVKHYPKPIYDKIIEPFAGSAAYSMMYFEKDVLLIEKYDVLVKLWNWLINEATEKEILALPSVVENDMIEKFDWLCQEEKWLMGFSLNRGSAQPKNKVKKFSDGWENVKKRIANDLHKIRHWKVIEGDYKCVENEEVTWFIDPPYQFGGEWYKHKNIDYTELHNYVMNRNGQIIVCENTKANWIDLTPLVKIQGSKNTNTIEAIFTKGGEEKRKEKDLQAGTLFGDEM